MIDGHERNAEGVTESLRAGDTDEQRTDQPGTRRHRDLLDIVPSGVCVMQRALHQGKEMLQMFPRRDFRNDTTERLMAFDLRGDEVDAHRSIALEQSDGCLIAGGLDAEDHSHESRTTSDEI